MRCSAFWGIKVLHNTKSKIPIKDFLYTQLTNICLGEITENKPTIVKATIETVDIDKIDSATNDAPVHKTDLILGILTPNNHEMIQINQNYSPLDTVVITAEGPNDVYASGYYSPFEDEEEEEEEEEEAASDLDESELTKKLMEVVNNSQDE